MPYIGWCSTGGTACVFRYWKGEESASQLCRGWTGLKGPMGRSITVTAQGSRQMSCCVFWWRLNVTCLTVLLAKHGEWKDLCFGKFVAILHIPSMWPWRLLTPKSGAHCLLLPMDPRTEWRLDIRIQGSGNEFDLSWTSFVSNTSTSIAPCCWLWQEHWKLDCCRSCPSSSGSKPLGVILSSEFVVVFK